MSGGLFARLGGRASVPPVEWIDAGELAAGLQRRAIAVVDVREPDEFTGPLGHIAGALNLPVGELSDRLGELDRLKDERVVLVCRHDRRSAQAAALLEAAGFRQVSVLRGGMVRWNEEERVPGARHAER
jgi:rhodanese-related sulfurtransferase